MNRDFIDSLSSLPLEEARSLSIQEIEKRPTKNIKQKAAKNRLIYDLRKAPDLNEITRILFMQILAQEDLRTVGSSWDKHYKNI